ncbi:MAG: CDP-alcohol phosphatidyltransferase family protein [Clostridia bacterium]|nr:CDP-alcohol phosphatidyltransferase family protein [Clostridia bacterium]
MSLPNIITLIRIVLIPVWATTFAKGYTMATYALLCVSAFTDVLDGWVARKFNMVSRLGTILDPIADKLTQFTVFVCLYIGKLIPVWLVVLLFIKELMMAVGAFVLLKKDVVIKANASGKFATVVFYCTAFVIFLLENLDMFKTAELTYWATLLTGIAVIAAFYAMFSYAKIFFKVMKQGKEEQKSHEQI